MYIKTSNKDRKRALGPENTDMDECSEWLSKQREKIPVSGPSSKPALWNLHLA